jgi:hypothetical protein
MKYRPITSGGSAVQAAEAARTGAAIRQGLAAASRPGAAPVNLQSLAAGVAAQQGAGAVQQAAKDVAMSQKSSDVRLGQIQQGAERSLADRRLRLKELQLEADRDLSDLGLQVEREKFDNNMLFERDELGRTAMNNIQLRDWAVMSAENRESYLDKVQSVELAHKRKIQLLETAHARLSQALTLESKEGQAKLNRETKERIVRAKAELERQIAEDKAKAANEMMMFTALTTIAGTAVGAKMGNPAAGAAVGQGLGQSGYAAYSANK